MAKSSVGLAILTVCTCNLAVLLGQTEVKKPYQLNVLTLFYEPDSTNYAIVQLVQDTINNRIDLLPDYRVNLQVQDEDSGYQVAKKVISYRDGYVEGDECTQAPIVIGPQFSTGCKAVGPILPYVKMVELSVSCGAPVLANHARYRNLYLMIQTSQYTGLAMLRYMRDMAKWNRFALLTNAVNANDYGSAILMQKVASDTGFVITYFSMVATVDMELVASVKATDSRIIVFFTANDDMLYNFLCLAYEQGMTGARYVFLALNGAFYVPGDLDDSSYEHCTLAVIIAQLKQTLFFGPAMNVEDTSLVSEFGHSQMEVDNYMQIFKNLTRPPDDPYRYIYYDSLTKGLFALHQTEEVLKRTTNLTLRDYCRFPDQVMKVANETLLKMDMAGVHINRMRYNKAGLPEGEGQSVGQWLEEIGFQNVALGVQHRKGGDDFTLDSFFISSIRPVQWLTTDGQPPRDLRTTERRVKQVPIIVLIAIIAIAVILSLIQIAAEVASLFLRTFLQPVRITHGIAFLGTVLLNVSAVMFVSDQQVFAAIILLAIGFTLSNGTLILRGIIVKWICPPLPAPDSSGAPPTSKDSGGQVAETPQQKRRQGTQRGPSMPLSRQSSVKSSRQSGRSSSKRRIGFPRSIKWKRFEKFTLTGVALFLALNAVILAAWFVVNAIKCSENIVSEVYIESTDVFIQTLMEVCASQRNMAGWSLGITFLHGAATVIGNLVAYLARRRTFFKPHFFYVQLGLANSGILILGILLALIVLQDAISQQITLAFGILVNSAITSMAIFSFSIAQPIRTIKIYFQVLFGHTTNVRFASTLTHTTSGMPASEVPK